VRPVRRQKSRDQIAKLRQAIAGLEAQQRELGLDFTQQIAELRRRLQEAGGVSLHGSGALATTGGVAAGTGGVAVGGGVQGSVFVSNTVNSWGVVIPARRPRTPAQR
jgi:hypothetical protein